MKLTRNWDHTPTRTEWADLLTSGRLHHADYYALVRYKRAHGVCDVCLSQWLASLPKARQRAAWAQITARMGVR